MVNNLNILITFFYFVGVVGVVVYTYRSTIVNFLSSPNFENNNDQVDEIPNGELSDADRRSSSSDIIKALPLVAQAPMIRNYKKRLW